MTLRALCLLTVLLINTRTSAADTPADYYAVMPHCKMMGAPVYQVDAKANPVKAIDTQGLIAACTRMPKKRMSCSVSFEEKGAKPITVEYSVDTETARLAVWNAVATSDQLVIDPSRSSAVLTVRNLSAGDGGTVTVMMKLCHGMFLTSDEFAELTKARQRPRR